MDQRQQRRETIKAECAQRGIAIEQRERCYLLHAPGVSLMAADLADLDTKDLAPYMPRKHTET